MYLKFSLNYLYILKEGSKRYISWRPYRYKWTRSKETQSRSKIQQQHIGVLVIPIDQTSLTVFTPKTLKPGWYRYATYCEKTLRQAARLS